MKKIAITDATLRECARRGDLALSFKEKIEIAKLLTSSTSILLKQHPLPMKKLTPLFCAL